MLDETDSGIGSIMPFVFSRAGHGIPRGRVVQRQHGSDPAQTYYVYWPESAPENASVMVSMHGISRNAGEHATSFVSYAERYGVVLVAPLFPKERFPRYQRVFAREGELRADLMLLAIIAEVAQYGSVNAHKLYLFGFSGGGQFVHRFAMRHPTRVARYVVAAAGWYTFPDLGLCFPRGMRPSKKMPRIVFDKEAFMAIPGAVIVGERDIRVDAALNMNPKITSQQGENRVERGRRWVSAMIETARQRGMPAHFSFSLAPRCGHSFNRAMKRGGMGEFVFTHLFGSTHSS